MNVQQISIDLLKPADYNPRKISKAELDKLKKNITEFGLVDPIIVNADMTVIGGHQRIKACRALKMDTVPCVVLNITKEKEKALNLALNRISGQFDEEMLQQIIGELSTLEEFDMELTGFDSNEIDKMIASIGKESGEEEDFDPDAESAKIAEPRTKRGDLWILGNHRVMCGDSRDFSDMDKLMNGKKINAAITSPPYASQRAYDETSGFKPIHPDNYVGWYRDIASNIMAHLSEDGSYFLNIKEHCDDGQRNLYVKDLTISHVREWGWRFVDEFVWTHGGTPKAVVNRFKNGWEPIFHFTKTNDFKFMPSRVRHETDSIPDWNGKHPSHERLQGTNYIKAAATMGSGDHQGQTKGATGNYLSTNGLAYPSNVISCGKNREALGHSAAFPTALPEFFIKAYSDTFDNIFDPFTGSGSTLIASEKNKRRFFGMEISPKYCDVIVARWEKYTGKTAVLETAQEPVHA